MNSVDPIISAVVAVRRTGASPDAAPAPSAPAPTPPASTESGLRFELDTATRKVVVRVTEGARSHWYFAGATFLAVDAIDDPRAYMLGKRLLEAGRSPDPAALADPATDLKTLLR